MKNKKIAVLYGGQSAERDVCLATGTAAYNALIEAGYQNTYLIDVDDTLAEQLVENRPDVCFIALHGTYGEDGRIQGLLEMMKIPYTGSDVTASAVCFDKVLTKQVIQSHDIPTADYYLPALGQEKSLMPCVVKPAREGSTIGISIVNFEEELAPAIQLAEEYEGAVIVEEFIQGKELTVSILNGQVLPAIWIRPKSGFYDYESKYTKGMTEYLFETELSETEMTYINDLALKTYQAMGCTAAARVDFIFDGKEAWVLEVNTLPGMTETSLLPKAAGAAGISFLLLVETLLNGALKR